MSTADGKSDTEAIHVELFSSLKRCHACDGSGRDKTVSYWVPCIACGGRGVVSVPTGVSDNG